MDFVTFNFFVIRWQQHVHGVGVTTDLLTLQYKMVLFFFWTLILNIVDNRNAMNMVRTYDV